MRDAQFPDGSIYSIINEDWVQGFDVNNSENAKKEPLLPAHLILLTDAADIFTSIERLQPQRIDKLTRINFTYIRVMSSRAYISFIDDLFNIADVGTKGR